MSADTLDRLATLDRPAVTDTTRNKSTHLENAITPPPTRCASSELSKRSPVERNPVEAGRGRGTLLQGVQRQRRHRHSSFVVNCHAHPSVTKIRICGEHCSREAVTNFGQIFLFSPLLVGDGLEGGQI